MSTHPRTRRASKRKAHSALVQDEQGGLKHLKNRKQGEQELPKDDIQGPRVVIEHWKCAEGVKAALLSARPELIVVLNPEKPRKKSLEVTLVKGGKEVCLWTGLNKGPPARLKFPDPALVVSALEKAITNE